MLETFLEEYNPIFHYVKGENNMFADALLHLPMQNIDNTAVHQAALPRAHNDIIRQQNLPSAGSVLNTVFTTEFTPESPGKHVASENKNKKIMDPLMNAHAFSVMMDDEVMLDCFLNFPKVMPEHPFVLDYSVIADAQNNDNELLTALQEFPDKYS